MVVPDPSEPAPTNQFPLIEAQVREAAEPRPDAPNQPNQPSDESFQGETVAKPRGFTPITLNLQDADARQALELLGQDASMNIFVASGVSGTVTANLRGMSSDEALNTILRLCNLVAHREGNSIFVYPPKDFPELDRVWKVIPLNYASAEDVVASINAIKGLLSPVGYVYAFVTGDPTQVNDDDPETSDNRRTQEAIVVQDAPDHVFRIERYVAELDMAPRQVQIQAYILEVDLKNNLQHGVNFEEIIHLAGNTATLQTFGFADPKATQAFFARIDGKNFDALLEALKTTTDAKTLANPKVTVLNGQMAHIQIGQKLGYRDTTTQTETAATQSVKFLELGVVLDVTPRITDDNRVIMTVKPKIADGRIDPISELPEEDTTEVVTNVLLEDGQGMVIGGLIKEKDSDIQGKVPFFGNLPYVGLLFQQRKKEAERKEVIIALLPRVLPLAPCPAAVERLEMIRATTPLFHGPMRRCPRPWEPTLRDALPERGDRL
ncbi:MAG: hypothetical protein JW719_05675 [Pirellulales bacterium]|nr:hypothetical protein [Pirellulales bacterium]